MKNQKRFLLFIVIILILALVYYFELPKFFTFETLKQQKDNLLALIEKQYWSSVITYIFVYCAVVALSLPGAASLSLLGGFLFGIFPGMLYIIIGATLGAATAFLLVRYLIGSWIQKKYKKQLVNFNQEIEQSGAHYLLAIRLIPIFPFFLINALAALTTISFSTFVLTTACGILPGAFVFSFAGKQFHEIATISDVMSPKMLLAFVLLALLALVPLIYKKLTFR